MSDVPELTGQEIRAFAEALNATRDKPLHLVVTPEGKLDVVEDSEIGSSKVILTCRTAPDIMDRPVVQTLTGTVRPKAPSNSFAVDFFEDHRYDALFLSETAVEKFVLPYYSRISKAADVQQLLDDYNKASVYAVAHLPKSIPDVLKNMLGRQRGEEPIHVLVPDAGRVGSASFLPLSEFLRK